RWQHRLKREHPTCTERNRSTKSADGRVATVGNSAAEKPCPTKKQKNPLDSDRPSLGRYFRTRKSRFPKGLACFPCRGPKGKQFQQAPPSRGREVQDTPWSKAESKPLKKGITCEANLKH